MSDKPLKGRWRYVQPMKSECHKLNINVHNFIKRWGQQLHLFTKFLLFFLCPSKPTQPPLLKQRPQGKTLPSSLAARDGVLSFLYIRTILTNPKITFSKGIAASFTNFLMRRFAPKESWVVVHYIQGLRTPTFFQFYWFLLKIVKKVGVRRPYIQ